MMHTVSGLILVRTRKSLVVSLCITLFQTQPIPTMLLLPESSVGSTWHWTAQNRGSEKMSRMLYDAEGAPAHLGGDQRHPVDVPLLNLLSDSIDPHCVSYLLAQLSVGSYWHWKAPNLRP